MAKKVKFCVLFLLIIAVVVSGVCFVFAPSKTINFKIVDENDSVLLEKSYSINEVVTKKAKKDKEYNFLRNKDLYEMAYMLNRNLSEDLKQLIKKNTIMPKNATSTFNLSKKNPFSYNEEKSGKKIDTDKLKTDLIESLKNNNSKIKIKYLKLSPDITIKKLQLKQWKISSFCTDYSFSSETRGYNIELAAKKINNTIIYPDEVFSFNERVGERSEKNGFKPAPIIYEGKFILGFGGGVCQVSSTLYNSVILAGLKIELANNHTLPVSYIEPSFDAMVSFWNDFKFKNDTSNPIYIKSFCENKKLYFEIYGQKPNFWIERESKVIKILPFKKAIVKDSDKPTGTIIKEGKNGYISQGFLIYHYDDRSTKKFKIRQDYYSPQNELVAENVKIS